MGCAKKITAIVMVWFMIITSLSSGSLTVYADDPETGATGKTQPTVSLTVSNTVARDTLVVNTIGFNGDPLLLEAVVNGLEGQDPTGQVDFYDGESLIASVPVNQTVASHSFSTDWSGTHYYHAVYIPDEYSADIYESAESATAEAALSEILPTKLSFAPSNKRTYTDNEYFDPTGLQVFVNYNDGTRIEVYDYTLEPDINRKLEAAQHYINIYYGNLMTYMEIQVSHAAQEYHVNEAENTIVGNCIGCESELSSIKILPPENLEANQGGTAARIVAAGVRQEDISVSYYLCETLTDGTVSETPVTTDNGLPNDPGTYKVKVGYGGVEIEETFTLSFHVSGDYYSFDEETGTLIITGEIPDFELLDETGEIPVYDTPWRLVKDNIKTVDFQMTGSASNVYRIGDGAFCGLTNLQEVKITTSDGSGSDFSYIGDYAFAGCTSLIAFNQSEGYNGEIFNTLRFNGYNADYSEEVTSKIGVRAFYGCNSLQFRDAEFNGTNIRLNKESFAGPDWGALSFDMTLFTNSGSSPQDIPESVLHAFDGMKCSTLNVYSSVPEYEESPVYLFVSSDSNDIWAAHNISYMDSTAYDPEHPESGDAQQLYGTERLALLYVQDFGSDYSFQAVEASAQELHGGYQTVVPVINPDVFKNNKSITNVVMGVPVTEGVFQGCTNLESVMFRDNAYDIGAFAFDGCTSLKKLYINGADTINGTMPVGSIGQYAFRNCTSLETFKLPSNNQTNAALAEGLFYGCSSLSEVSLSDYVIEIKPYTFAGCTALTAFTVPKGVNEIEANTFGTASEALIPNITLTFKNVATLNSNSFSGIDAVTVRYPQGNTEWESRRSKGSNYGAQSITWEPYDACQGNHTPVADADVEVTCTTDGSTGGSHCSLCNAVVEEPQIIPALGHDFGEWVVTVEPTEEAEGQETRTCSRCGLEETRTLEKLIRAASINGQGYPSLTAAIAASQNGDTIVLEMDIQEDIVIPSGKNIIIDLNGHKIQNVSAVDTIINEGNLTLLDGGEVSIEGMGCVENTSSDCVPIRNTAVGTLVISGGQIKNADLNVEVIINYGSLTVSGGTVSGSIANLGSRVHLIISGGTVTGYIAASNASAVTITGGSFGTDVSQYLDSDHTTVHEGEYYTITDQIRVTVRSMDETSLAEVANVSGGGAYAKGASVRVTASVPNGYSFVGWYAFDGSTYTGSLLSTSISYQFVADSSIDLAAVYRVNQDAGEAELKVHGADFRVNGGVNQKLYNYTQKFALNTQITLEATGDDFLYWMNSSNKIVETARTYTFQLVMDTSITPVYKYAEQATAFVEFVSDYDQIMQAQNYAADSVITMPTGPSKSGHTFQSWKLTADEIRNLISSGETYIRVKANYQKIEGTLSLKVIFDGNVVEENQLAVSSQPVLNAIPIEGRKFAYWMDDRGNILSTRSAYKYYLTRDVTINAVYVDASEETEQSPAIAMTDVAGFVDDGTNKIRYTIIRDIPDDYTVLKQGAIYSTNATYGQENGEDLLVLGGNSVGSSDSSKTDNQGYYDFTVSVGSKVDVVVYVKGYATIKNNKTGETTTIYTSMANVSYSQL